jgi:hypothetical protein
LACPARFERATYALEGRCSIQLSYGQSLIYKAFKSIDVSGSTLGQQVGQENWTDGFNNNSQWLV